MTSQNSKNTPASSSEILSDEELRSRAAAAAQQVYERQLEAYRAQREQLLEVQRVREEYERRRAAYEEACRAYYEAKNRSSVPSAVRVNPDTGAQVFAPRKSEGANPPPPSPPSPSPVEKKRAARPSAPSPEVSVPAAPEPRNVSDAEVIDEPSEDVDEPSISEAPSSEKSERSENPPEGEAEAEVRVPAGFPVFSVLTVILLVSGLSALGYVVFSGDPRFDEARGRILSLIVGGEKDATVAAGAAPAGEAAADSAPVEAPPASPSEGERVVENRSAFGDSDARAAEESSGGAFDEFSEIFSEE